MWLFELLGLVIVTGTVAGLAWRYTEDFLERRVGRKQSELELADESDKASAPVASTTKSN